MRGSVGTVGGHTDLIIGDGVSNIVHEFGHSPSIFIVFRVAHSLNAT